MDLRLLKMMIQAACADGILSEDERLHLEDYAKEIGISIKNLNFLVEKELELIKLKLRNTGEAITPADQHTVLSTSDDSGFVTGSLTENNNQSGFVTNYETFQPKSPGVLFTDIVTLNTNGAMSLIQKAKYYGKWVIIKRIKHEFKNDSRYRELFYKEFENAFHLEHTNIARVYGKGEDKNGLFYYMEFIDGRPLSKLIGKKGISDGNLIRKIAIDILQTLGYIHKKQIYHRDLKPDNILVTYKGDNAKLIDFGLAAADYFEDHLLNAGTPRYAAPEQITNNAIVDGRSDIYSFGLILLEMLTGQIESANIAKERSTTLFLIIRKCINQNIQERYSDCSGIVEDIRTVTIKPIITKPIARPLLKLSGKTPVVNPRNFLFISHEIWKTGNLNEYNDPYSTGTYFVETAIRSEPYQFFLSFYDSFMQKTFKDYFFLHSEYLVRNDKRSMILTNYRLFLNFKNEEQLKAIPLYNIDTKKVGINKMNRLYVQFNNCNLWKSDWEIVKKVLAKKEWTALDKKYLPLLEYSKKELPKGSGFNNIRFEFDFDILQKMQEITLRHCTIDDFIEFTKQTWHSDRLIGLYNDYYYNHSEEIQRLEPLVKNIFSIYYPLKDEFFLLDSYHQDGLITNFRLFYKTGNSQSYYVLPLSNVKKYRIENGGLFSRARVEVERYDNSVLKLPLSNIGDIHTSKVMDDIRRINQVAGMHEYDKLDSEELKLLLYNQETTNSWWEHQ